MAELRVGRTLRPWSPPSNGQIKQADQGSPRPRTSTLCTGLQQLCLAISSAGGRARPSTTPTCRHLVDCPAGEFLVASTYRLHTGTARSRAGDVPRSQFGATSLSSFLSPALAISKRPWLPAGRGMMRAPPCYAPGHLHQQKKSSSQPIPLCARRQLSLAAKVPNFQASLGRCSVEHGTCRRRHGLFLGAMGSSDLGPPPQHHFLAFCSVDPAARQALAGVSKIPN
ncbi:uncharacterized protein BKA78DRAFT_189716 [Phyllosticta capitalensis]|uniref:Uncharacterized protein n=1 Tax=Phyllosticta capitalensis TaxID=121624 RepID=A0ABR1YFW2_9PEZI